MTYREQGAILARAFEAGAFDELADHWWRAIGDRRSIVCAALDAAESLLGEPTSPYAWDLVLDAAPPLRNRLASRVPLGLFYTLRGVLDSQELP